MWRHSQNGADVRPSEVDDTSSRAYVYVRRNIVRVEGDGEDTQDHYEWDELRIPRESWEMWVRLANVCSDTETQGDAIDDLAWLASDTDANMGMVMDAIADLGADVSALYDMVAGGE